MRSHRPVRGAPRRAAGVLRRHRALAIGLLAPGAVAVALVAAGTAPSPAAAADPPGLIVAHRVNTIGCVAGPYNTVRARVRLWMRVVNDDGIGEWADRMEAKARLEPTTTGLNWTRTWTSHKTGRLGWNHKYMHRAQVVTDNVSGTAEWRVHVKLIWHRPAPIRNITKDLYFPFTASCAGTTGGGALPPPAAALPAPNGG